LGFEFYNRNLAKELHERKHIEDDGDYLHNSHKFFSEAEIWYIIDSLASVVGTFRDHDYHHGDVQPKNILIDNEGFVKLLDNSLVNYGTTAYQKMLVDNKYEAALSPLLLESLKTRAQVPIHSKVKSDMFSIGITALCAATNTKVNHYYDWSQKRVNMAYPQEIEGKLKEQGSVGVEDRVGQDLERMRTIQYSEQLVGVIAGLLQYHEADRIGVDELRGFIKESNLVNQGGANFNGRYNITVRH
jgi:serine/threonine protein kinase